MVLAEIFSLILYLISLAVLHEYFGKWQIIRQPMSYLSAQINLTLIFRLGIHLVVGFLVESFCDYISFMSTTLCHQISTQKILTTILFEIILKPLEIIDPHTHTHTGR